MKAAYIFLADGFEDMEALCTVDILRRGLVPVKTVSIYPGRKTVESAHAVKVSADLLERQKAELRRRHRKTFYINDREKAAIEEYCERFGVSSKAALYREAIMDKVLTALEENHPTLF